MPKKVALITGATGGIGEAITRRLGSLGYSLALVYGQNHKKAWDLKTTILEAQRVETYSCDFNDREEIKKALEKVRTDFLHVDVVVHAAGVSFRGMFDEMDEDDFERSFNVNVKPLFYLTRGLIPGMVSRQEGDIIAISSIWGSRPASYEIAYAMTKGALEQFARGLAAELAHMGIRVNAIAPGGIDTEILSNLSPEERESFIQDIPFHRLGTPEEVADLVEFLVTKGRYITGQVITMDGGFTL